MSELSPSIAANLRTLESGGTINEEVLSLYKRAERHERAGDINAALDIEIEAHKLAVQKCKEIRDEETP